MIIKRIARPVNSTSTPMTLPELVEFSTRTVSGQSVTAESSRNVSTAYRCINILSDDVAKMPLQTLISTGPGKIERMRPNNRTENLAWLMEVRPNRYMTPFVFKKILITWLVTHGDCYAWQPPRRPGRRREIFILPSDRTYPVYDRDGNVWYRTEFLDHSVAYLPDVEVFHLMINSTDGISGRGVITYARETIGRQLGAHDTQGRFYGQGLNASGLLWVAGEVNSEARKKIRAEYERAMSGSENAYRLAVLDNKVTKFEQITMKPVDAQFLEGIAENDLEIANFFGMPLFKLNMGKQAYNSNEQANLDYLNTTLDPYLIQAEQEALLKWLTEEEQNTTYLRFNRDVLLRTDATARTAVLEKKILSGQLTPNEARQIEDMPAYAGGDNYFVPANMAVIAPGGEVQAIGGQKANNG
jgi:HK97 family phage portal protein